MTWQSDTMRAMWYFKRVFFSLTEFYDILFILHRQQMIILLLSILVYFYNIRNEYHATCCDFVSNPELIVLVLV
jgi:hypothetical protein